MQRTTKAVRVVRTDSARGHHETEHDSEIADMLVLGAPASVRTQLAQKRRATPGELKKFVGSLEVGIDWQGALEYIKQKNGFAEDKQLSQLLDIPSSTLSAVKYGRAELSDVSKIAILDYFGFNLVADALNALKLDEVGAKRRRLDQRKEAKRPRSPFAKPASPEAAKRSPKNKPA